MFPLPAAAPDASTVFAPRPKSGRSDVTTLLRDFALVNYAVSLKQLASLLPDGVEPERFELDDGREVGLVSAVPFRDVDFRFGFAPFFRSTMGQTNYRAYVLRNGRRAVWFFGTTLDSFWTWVPRKVWKLPWHPAQMRFESRWDAERCEHYRLDTKSPGGDAELELVGTSRPMGRLDGFRSEDETAAILTHPLEGIYRRRDKVLGTYSVWHERLRPLHAEVRTARFQVFEDLGLITANCQPHSVLVQRETEFIIFLPPKPLAESVR